MHEKEKGELAELKFHVRAIEEGFVVSKPFGDSCPYDFIIDHKGHLSRVQLKSIWSEKKRQNFKGYHWRHSVAVYRISILRSSRQKYKSRDIDYLIIYIQPVDVWFIIPVIEIEYLEGVTLRIEKPYYKHKSAHRGYRQWSKYKEAWFLPKLETAKAEKPKKKKAKKKKAKVA